jgi:hypothetical protein
MNERERYEKKVLAMIRETPVMSYWRLDSRRLMAALVRLEKHGVIRREVLGFPCWGFTILKEKKVAE